MFKITDVTIGGMYKPAMEITSQEDADSYFELLVAYQMGAVIGSGEYDDNHTEVRERAENIVRQNLGYFAGYYDIETRKRVNQLFLTTHPIFGG